MQLNVTNFVKSSLDHMYWDVPLMVWELEVSEVENHAEIKQELERNDIWLEHKHYPKGRYRYNRDANQSTVLTEFVSNIETTLVATVYDTIFAQEPVRAARYKPVEWYRSKAICADIYKDTAGFKMPPHLDNQHVLAQIIINLTPGKTSTKFHSPADHLALGAIRWQDLPAQYTAPTQELKGIVFFNNANSVHSISGLTEDRYILYMSLVDYIDRV